MKLRVSIVSTAILILVVCASSLGCKSQPYLAPYTPRTTVVTVATTVVIRATTAIGSPKGSILDYTGNWDNKSFTQEGVTYYNYTMSVRVQNVGDDGSFWVYGAIYDRTNISVVKYRSETEVYLRKGEEKTIPFLFQIAGNEAIRYNAYCLNQYVPFTT